MSVSRTNAEVLVVRRSRAGAWARLSVCLFIIGGFWSVLLTEMGAVSGAAVTGSQSLLLIVPLCLLPYLIDSVRLLKRGEASVFDAKNRRLILRDGVGIAFADISAIELRAVNAGCEELSLNVCLRDGRVRSVLTATASSRIVNLANEAARLVGVELSRA